MKRQIHASSPPLSPSPSEVEPVSKRARLLVPSPTPPPEIDQEDLSDEEPIVESVTLAEDSPSDDDDDDNDDIIEVEQPNFDRICREQNDTVILVSDSDSDDESDDQGIDVTDDIFSLLPSPSITITAPISPAWSEEIEIVQEDEEDLLPVMEDIDADDDTNESEFLEIVADDLRQELIDLTDDDQPTFVPCSPSSSSPERKTSIDVQQCPICLETLSYLQRTGVHLIITRCRHVMCTLCSRQLLAISPRCPLCRENLSATALMPYCILI